VDSLSTLYGALAGMGVLIFVVGSLFAFIQGLRSRSYVWITASLILCALACVCVQIVSSKVEQAAHEHAKAVKSTPSPSPSPTASVTH
jgi:membrane-bound ClpP family serine protease